MSQSNSTAMNVDLLDIQSEFTNAIDVHGSECFIDLAMRVSRYISNTESSPSTSNRSTSSLVMPAFLRTAGIANAARNSPSRARRLCLVPFTSGFGNLKTEGYRYLCIVIDNVLAVDMNQTSSPNDQ